MQRTNSHEGLVGRAFLLCVLLAQVGCMKQPEESSGPDAYRHTASEMPFGEPFQDGFSWRAGDRTDWKRVIVPEDGLLTVDVRFVNVKAAARVGLFDTYGKLVTKRVKESDRDQQLRMSERVPAGRYFLRIMADEEGDASEYTVTLLLE